ncbi:hypothetical protein LX15_000908 [Streptoalloteichus tenebrarius]|uniref:Transcriptional regulator n=1 Tax=Streptoalloteichus tenebrarius (strain ATCC 17920 / DSM 40477 / JCM 4838 / CBS 697.72 / NBRC 16177 / NCIMB 11028 / NRRL B-12390 / A12253. 1 / ISP 5477) TaxID=1933 RepID=A0ABT1HNY3_STRSD|nr:hypothetical protein [Streptoalloteichus tenebrarius]MCP2257223.1 hypothetical protein [Streptoalloteichus tenebrarius]
MDRRGFLITTGASLAGTALAWSSATASAASNPYPRIGSEAITSLSTRLAHLSRLDDVWGSGKLRDLAAAELRLLTGLITDTTHTTEVEQGLYGLAAEAARLCGWLSYDSGHHAAAQRYYLTALRASATAGDTLVGANTMAFMAIQLYSRGNPQDAVALVETAQRSIRGRATPKTIAILHARQARALSKLGDQSRCATALNAAFDAITKGCDHEPSWCYWINTTELHMLAGSCALDLGDARRAVHHFTTAKDSFDIATYPAGAVIYLARAAEAHLALGDPDAAADLCLQAVRCHDSIDSARADRTLAALRARLARHRTPVVREFLDQIPPSSA